MQTGRYIHIDRQDRTFHNQHHETITAKQALDFAMPEGQKYSHSLDIKPEREISIVDMASASECGKIPLLAYICSKKCVD